MTITSQQFYNILTEKFNFSNFRPGQLETLTALSKNCDTLSVLPTGAGKTLIYECYGYAVGLPVLIVSPLVSLMQDQVRSLNMRGEKSVTAITSLMSFTEKRIVLQQLNRYRFIFSSPEMLTQKSFLAMLKKFHVGLLVIDEAHCISMWGPDFRPEYLLLSKIRELLGRPLTLMTTATATPRMKTDILEKMQVPFATQIKLSTDRPNIYLKVVKIDSEQNKKAKLIKLVQRLKKPGIVYFSSRKMANTVCKLLRAYGITNSATYHSGLDDDARYKIQQQFMDDELDVICATNAFGMGINKKNIRFVIHYHLPVNLANYWQEIGRAGRDGQQSIAILLYEPGDERLSDYLGKINIVDKNDIISFYAHPRLVSDDDPLRLVSFYWKHHIPKDRVISLFAKQNKQRSRDLDAILAYVNVTNCRRYFIQEYFGEQYSNLSKNCCDQDQRCTTIDMLQLTDTPPTILPNDVLPWNTILDRLF